ncbi:MAG: hypothetical protein Q9191_000536 [Dirinaria sp. TL-2023a]
MQYSKLFSISFLIAAGLLPGISGASVNGTSSANPASNDADAITAISQLLSLFSITLDTKDFSALRGVYASNAILGGDGAAQNITGISAIESFYRAQFGNASVSTQHTSDTVYVSDVTATSARSVSYGNAFYFGPKVLERGGQMFSNQSVVFRERFDNKYSKGEDGWRISLQTGPTVLAIEGDTSLIAPPPPPGQD